MTGKRQHLDSENDDAVTAVSIDSDQLSTKLNSSDFDFVLKAMGTTFNLGETKFFCDVPLFLVNLDDYTLIVNDGDAADILQAYAPRSLKTVMERRWHYAIHLPQMQMAITQAMLRDRVNGGEILAYKYTEGNIEGNTCCYYGFVPTIVHTKDAVTSHKSLSSLLNINDGKAFNSRGSTHRICRVTAKAIWPRKLYIYLKRTYPCPCSKGCQLWQVMVRNSSDLHTFCIKQMPWGSLYVMMGDADETAVDTVKDLRVCSVCAQCIDCSKSSTFCRRHRICKHKKSMMFELNTSDLVSDSNIKLCRRTYEPAKPPAKRNKNKL